jgi:formylglycine-generating enzyme required for sulfatase activity
MRRALTCIVTITLAGFVLTRVTPAAAYEAIQGPTELRYWDPTVAYNGYTLFAGAGKSYLIDMEGRLVHTWAIGTNPRLLDNGHLLDAATDDPSGFAGFKEVDWDGNVVWQYHETRTTYAPHHDFVRIYNKKLGAYTTLYIANKTVTNEQCLAAGCDPADAPYTGAQVDAVVEVDMSGNVVWEWWFFDHVIQDIDATKPNYVGAGKTVADYPGRLNLNLPGHPVRRDWLHCNSMDYSETLGQIVINSVQGEFYVIDHDGTFVAGDPAASIACAASPAGDFLYRFGDPARYEQGDPPSILEDWTSSTTGNKQIGGSHDIHWIDEGLPGAGHFLVFNNGQYLFERTPQSYVFEINGFLDATKADAGHYVNPPAAGYYRWETDSSKDTHKQPKQMSNQIAWIYTSKSNQSFFSHIGSSAQRLPNGNTLICADTEGHMFEVTAAGDLVWEYINPVTRSGALEVLPDTWPMTNSVFRAYRYAADHPAFAGRDMTPGGTITGGTPEPVTPAQPSTPGTPRPTRTPGGPTPAGTRRPTPTPGGPTPAGTRRPSPTPAAGSSATPSSGAQTVGLFLNDGRAWPGYTLFAPKHFTTTYLIDNAGRVVHSWTGGRDEPGQSAYLLENGHLLRPTMTKGPLSTGGGEGGRVEEFDWDGNLVWELDYSTETAMQHHDVHILPNGNLLMLAVEKRTYAEAIAAGFDPAKLDPEVQSKGFMVPDTVVEIQPTRPKGGTVVWTWRVWDHLIQDLDRTKANYSDGSAHPERVDTDGDGGRIPAFWNHMNAIDYNADLDQIMLSVRGNSEVWIIDHSTTNAEAAGHTGGRSGKGGDLLYRWGNPATYGAGTRTDQKLFQQHDAEWVAAGSPGAGDITVFNNGLGRNYSTVDEWTPPVDASGRYALTAGRAFGPSGFVWSYKATPPESMYAEAISGAQRLPNGNTLIDDGTHGVFTEVTASGETVWKYVNPVVRTGPLAWNDTIPSDPARAGEFMNAVFRVYRYALDYPGLAGRDLTPGAPVELRPGGQPTVTTPATATTPASPTARVTVSPVPTTPAPEPRTALYLPLAYGGSIAGRDVPTPTAGTPPPTSTDPPTVSPTPDASPTAPASPTAGAPGWSMRALPDTGQVKDYAAIFGEDSDYTINLPAFTDPGNGTIVDEVTGLVWQKTDGGEMTWANAVTICAGLDLGGSSDWRLPNSHELFSILNHDHNNPALDTTFFPATGAQYWWSGSERAGDTGAAWSVNAGGGIGPHPKSETVSAGGSKRFHARCVQGPAGGTSGAFVDHGDGTVTDGRTGLTWQQATIAAEAWDAALPACEGLSLAGRDDWRLPNIKELRSISDDSRSRPSVDETFFPATAPALYWSSTSNTNNSGEAWSVTFESGLVSHDAKTGAESVRCVRGGPSATPPASVPETVLVPGGQFEMGDHHNFVDPSHPSDEGPIHTVRVDAMFVGKYEVTVQQYAEFLNSALAEGTIEVRGGIVYGKDGTDIYLTTREADEYSRIGWDGGVFRVLDDRGNHPITSVRWFGAVAYANWISSRTGLVGCYNLATGACDFDANGYRLPTEAEWEYAGRGGQYDPYRVFPWGDDADNTKANWPSSGDPYESGALPWTTPVGFYDGEVRQKSEFHWPGSQATYQTSNGANAYGLYDMSGNVWEYVYDWYGQAYYSVSPTGNPTGPTSGTVMADGKPYRGMRGGNWYNGENGHGRVANRNPSYYRGPQDPNHPYYHLGFRVVRSASPARGVTGATTGPVGRPTSRGEVSS